MLPRAYSCQRHLCPTNYSIRNQVTLTSLVCVVVHSLLRLLSKARSILKISRAAGGDVAPAGAASLSWDGPCAADMVPGCAQQMNVLPFTGGLGANDSSRTTVNQKPEARRTGESDSNGNLLTTSNLNLEEWFMVLVLRNETAVSL